MRPIPQKLRRRLIKEYGMDTCIVCGKRDVEWNHVWANMGSKQINEIWSIVPLCVTCHRGRNGTINKRVKEKCEYESIMRLLESGLENLDKYQKPLDHTWENRIVYYTKYYENKHKTAISK